MGGEKLNPEEWRDKFLEFRHPILDNLVDELKELDCVVQVWVRPERTYTKVFIAMSEQNNKARERIYDIESKYLLRSDCILDFRVFNNPHDIESNWRYKVLLDQT